MFFPSYSGTLWWYSKVQLDETNTYSIRLVKVLLPLRKFVRFSVCSGMWNNAGRKREGQGSSNSLSNTIESFWKRSGGREASFRLHSSSKSSVWNSLETQPKYCTLGTTEEAQDLRNSGKRNYLQSWLTSQYKETALTVWLLKTEIEYFSKVCDTKTRTQAHVEVELASQQQQHEQQPQQPISHTDVPSLRKQMTTWENNAEVQDDSKHIAEADQVLGNWKQHECGYSSQWQRGQHRCILEKRSCERRTHRHEYISHWKNQNWFTYNLYSRRSGEGEDPAKLFSR